MRKAALSLLALAVTLLVASPASASFHLMKIVQVFGGPDSSYVQLQMYSVGQSSLGGHFIKVYDAAGVEQTAAGVALAAVTNGDNQATILIGTSGVEAAFGAKPDFVLPTNLTPAGGKVCFDDIDCFAWGNYTGAATGVGTPFAALPATQAATRKLGNGTLEDLDDTGDSAADFEAAAPAPKANPKPGSSSGGADAGKDSGVSTKPSDPSTSSSGSTSTSSSSGSSSTPPAEDEGCSVASPGATDHLSYGALALTLGTAIVVMARSRRRKR